MIQTFVQSEQYNWNAINHQTAALTKQVWQWKHTSSDCWSV